MDASHIKRIDGCTCAGGTTTPPPPVLEYLRKRGPDAVFSYDSSGRLTVVKGDDAVCLGQSDLELLRRFVRRVTGVG